MPMDPNIVTDCGKAARTWWPGCDSYLGLAFLAILCLVLMIAGLMIARSLCRLLEHWLRKFEAQFDDDKVTRKPPEPK